MAVDPRSRIEQIYREHRTIITAVIFLLVIILGTIIFYHRFPDNFKFPNFFAEDGDHFTINIMQKGFFGGLLTPFNGYFIFGIYILTGLGFVLNHILYAGQFVDLPASYAIVSYAFLATCCALPIVFLKDYLRLPYRLAITLMMILIPMPSFDYATIGTIGNLKFAFVFISILMVLYRIKLDRNSRIIPWLDLMIVISLFTTAGTYIVIPFMLLSDGLHPKNLRSLSQWKALVKKKSLSLWSFVAVVLLGLVQVAYVGINGVPYLPNYLNQPYQFSKTIEVFIARCYLYPFVAGGYHHLHNSIVLILFILALYVIIKYGKREHRWVYAFLLISIFSTTLIFIANRTGVTSYYNHYLTTGFDNFFYTQNFIAILVAGFLLSDLSSRLKWFRNFRLGIVVVVLVVLGELYASTTHAPSTFMAYEITPLKEQVSQLCADGKSPIKFSVYPFTFLQMTESRATACTKDVINYKPNLDNFGLKTDNDPFNISPTYPKFTQTFRAGNNNLQGLAIYLSTYSQTILNNYQFKLLNSTCTQTLATVKLPKYVADNAYATLKFPTQANSLGKSYCFTIQPTSTDAQQLALQSSQVTFAPNLTLKIGTAPQNRDAVFEAIY